mgnify:CR=1 FL=1
MIIGIAEYISDFYDQFYVEGCIESGIYVLFANEKITLTSSP